MIQAAKGRVRRIHEVVVEPFVLGVFCEHDAGRKRLRAESAYVGGGSRQIRGRESDVARGTNWDRRVEGARGHGVFAAEAGTYSVNGWDANLPLQMRLASGHGHAVFKQL